jgi:hypothetical protein
MGVNKSVFLVLILLHTNQQGLNTSTTRNISRITIYCAVQVQKGVSMVRRILLPLHNPTAWQRMAPDYMWQTAKPVRCAITLGKSPIVQTVCGQGQLFAFGDNAPHHWCDHDGMGLDAQLQHCSGLASAKGVLWIADTNNHAIRCLHLNSSKVTTLPLPQLCSPYACAPGNAFDRL